MEKLRDAASFLKNKFQTDELDQKLAQAVSEQNWQASTQLLHEIANASYNFEKEQKIIAFIYDKIKNKSWKKVLKTLHLVDFLIKYGPTSLINNLKDNIYDFRQLDDFKHFSEGIDRGQSIRKQAKAIVLLLSDDHMLNDQRSKAKQIKDRMATVIGSGAYYGNFSSDTRTSGSTFDNKNSSNYGNFNSETYKYSGSINSGNMSFGQSVMKQLQEKKKKETPVVEQKKPNPPKLNLASMNQRKVQKKADQSKPNFNNMKLVKPPEKKTATEPKIQTKKPQTTTQNSQQNAKQIKEFDIMDLDLGAMAANSSITSNQTNSFDFLGSSPPKKAQTFNFLQEKNVSINLSVQKPIVQNNNFLLSQPNNVTENKPQHYQNPTFNSFQAPNYAQPYQINANLNMQGFSLNYPNTTVPTNSTNSNTFSLATGNNKLNISLNTGQKIENKPADSLIDFSDFRQELKNVGTNEKKESITQNWVW